MPDPERARTIVFEALSEMKVNVAAVDPQKSVLHVLVAARPTDSAFRLDALRERLLKKIVEAVIGQREVEPDHREGYESDLLFGDTVERLVSETAKLIQALEQKS